MSSINLIQLGSKFDINKLLHSWVSSSGAWVDQSCVSSRDLRKETWPPMSRGSHWSGPWGRVFVGPGLIGLASCLVTPAPPLHVPVLRSFQCVCRWTWGVCWHVALAVFWLMLKKLYCSNSLDSNSLSGSVVVLLSHCLDILRRVWHDCKHQIPICYGR